jgi:hypothetical protein
MDASPSRLAFFPTMPAVDKGPAHPLSERRPTAMRALPECHLLRTNYASGELQCVLEIKVGVGLPLPESFQRLTQELARFKTRQLFRGFLTCACARRSDNPAHRGEDSRLAAVPSRFEEYMKGAGCRSALALVRIKPPPPPLSFQLIARQAAPPTDSLRAGAVRHHADGQLIAPEVAAQPVVLDVDFHLTLPGSPQPTVGSPHEKGVCREFCPKPPPVNLLVAIDNAAPIDRSGHGEAQTKRKSNL